MTEKEKRVQQLVELKSGVFPGIWVVEQLNSAFHPVHKWEYETKQEAESKFYELRKGGIYPAFINTYVRFTW